MKKVCWTAAVLVAGLLAFGSCGTRRPATDEEEYLQVIGEYEAAIPETGFRLNLTFNGPLDLRNKFQEWADSLQKVTPSMVKLNDNIYINYMPEQMDRKISRSQFQAGLTYSLQVKDSAAYNRITRSLFSRNLPFHLNVTGSYLEPERKAKLQQEMLQQALANARQKLDFLNTDTTRTYQIVSIEELDQTAPYAPEYYEYNRRALSRVKVKARLTD